MLRDRLAERPRVVAFVAIALVVLLVAAALVGVAASGGEGSAGSDRMASELRSVKAENERLNGRQLSTDAATAKEESERADRVASELRDLKAENRRLKRRQRRLGAGAATALRQAGLWKRRYQAERRAGRDDASPLADGKRRGRKRR